jgi:autotransporter-associated beta strand protein
LSLNKEQTGIWRLSGNNTFSGAVTISAGRLIAASENALGAAGKIINVNSSSTLELAMDGAMSNYNLNTASATGNASLVINRATAGEAPTRVFDAYTLGNSELIIQPGANVTSGTPTLQINSVGLSAGVAGLGLAKITANGVNVVIGNLSRSGVSAGALVLAGSSTGNRITGVVSNGSQGNYTITKDDTGTWELAGANTYTGAMTIRRGTLSLTGARTNTTAMGGIVVANTSGQNATLNITDGIHNLGTNEFRIASTTTTAVTGTVNQSGGDVRLPAGAGNQLLIGASTAANRGIYNLSGGTITIGLSSNAGRGVILGVNTGAAGGTFNLSGTGTLNMTLASGGTGDATLAIGRHDSDASNTNNTFNQTGGTANVGILSMGGTTTNSSGVTSLLSITGGTFRANLFPRMAAGNTNTATVVIGGTADVTLPAFPTARGTSSTATLNFDGGTLRPLATSATYISGLTNAFIRSGGAHISSGVDITIPQILRVDPASTGGGFTKSGSGRVNLTAVNTYTGDTIVSAGTLSLGNGTANSGLADAADVSIASGATLNLNYSGTDQIDELIINGQRRIAGVWGAVGSGAANTDPALSGAGTLTVTTGAPPLSDYEVWASGYTPAVGLAAADDDGDGLSNFQEYAFGLNPKSGDSSNPISQALNPSTGTFKYTRRATPATTGISYSYESSTTLTGSWPTFVPTTATSNNATPVEEMTVTVPAELLQETKLFLRVKASQP